jgi:hypothetical protein
MHELIRAFVAIKFSNQCWFSVKNWIHKKINYKFYSRKNKRYMRYFILLIIFILFNKSGIAQSSAGFDFFMGYGYYQGLNIGSEFVFKSGKQSVSLFAGIDKASKRNQKSL